MPDNAFFDNNDLREPFISADLAEVTLDTSAKALYPKSAFPVLNVQYFNRLGKKMRIRLFGRITTGLTPGNGSFNVYYGSGADADGVLLMTGSPVALSASQTSLSWQAEIFVHTRSIGALGTLFVSGSAHFHSGVVASALAPILLPASEPTVSGECDLTAGLRNIISVQFLRSGSTAETMQVHDMEISSIN